MDESDNVMMSVIEHKFVTVYSCHIFLKNIYSGNYKETIEKDEYEVFFRLIQGVCFDLVAVELNGLLQENKQNDNASISDLLKSLLAKEEISRDLYDEFFAIKRTFEETINEISEWRHSVAHAKKVMGERTYHISEPFNLIEALNNYLGKIQIEGWTLKKSNLENLRDSLDVVENVVKNLDK